MNSGMRAALIAALSVLVAPFALAQTPITDATGRTFKVPDPVRKVFAAGPPASVFVLALAPEKLAGWLGRAIGANAAGESLARDIEASLARIDTRVASIPVERRPKIFYARGPNGLATAPRGSACYHRLRVGVRSAASILPTSRRISCCGRSL